MTITTVKSSICESEAFLSVNAEHAIVPYIHPLLGILEQSFDGIGLLAAEPWRMVYANPALVELLGSGRHELAGRRVEEVFRGKAAERLRHAIECVCQGDAGETSDFAAAFIECPGPKTAEARLCRVDWNGQILVGIICRSTAAAGPEVAVAAGHGDTLTGLPDRAFLLSRLAELLNGDRSADRQFAVLFVDLDNFKQVNDSHGHLVGDRVLREAARQLSNCVRAGDHIVRYGGDEFVVLVERVTGGQDIEPVVARIHAALQKPIALPDGEVVLTVSVGVAQATSAHHTPEDLIAEADRAMYASKRPGG